MSQWADWWGMRQDCFAGSEGRRRGRRDGRRDGRKMGVCAVENVTVANLSSSISSV